MVILLSLVALPAIPAAAQTPFLGEIDLVAFNFAPAGWEFCDGSILPISEFTALFSLLGTTFGGDGKTTFALPDLRGRRAIGFGQGPGLQSYTLGEMGGEETVTLTLGQLPNHGHTPMASNSLGTAPGPGGNVWATQTQVFLYSSVPTSTVAMSPSAIGSTGGGQPHDNMPPYLVLNYIIATQGIYPARD
jgi:microcystin-dependent protein